MDKVIMPSELTAANGGKGLLIGEFYETQHIDCCECYGEGCEDCEEKGYEVIKIPVSWTTIKDIYNMAVDHFGESTNEQ